MQHQLTQKNAALPFVLVCVLLDVIGFGLIIPVLPALVGEFTQTSQSQALWYGVSIAAYGFAQFFAAPLLGALSDRYGRRPVLLLSQLGWGLDFILIALAPNLWIILLARFIGGATGAGFTVASAYVADVTTAEKRTQGMGMIGAMFGLGFIVGPAMGGVLGEYGVRVPFYAAAVVAVLNVVYGYYVLPESLPVDKRTVYARGELLRKSNPLTALAVLMRLPRGQQGVDVGRLVLALAITHLAQFMMHATFVLYTTQRYGWSPQQNGMGLFVAGLAHALVQGVLLGVLVKKMGEKRLVVVALMVGALEFVCFGLAAQGWMIYAAIAVMFIGGASGPALMGLLSNNVSQAEQGAVMGASTGIAAAMMVVAPLIATPILAATNHFPPGDWRFGTVFYAAAAMQCVSVWLVLRALKR
jgi:MFS transporter, DHA1 family, tetracycline resistance protein